nr:uncharacterized protein LOC117280238 [Nicotiana tomentosiformis]
MSAYNTHLISRLDLLKYIFQKLMPIRKLAKWQILLGEFDIVYVTQKAIKGKALVDHLVKNLVDRDYELLTTYFPKEEMKSQTVKHGTTMSGDSLQPKSTPKNATNSQKRALRRLANHVFLNGELIYRRTPGLGLLSCVDAAEATRLLEEIDAGTCGPHMNGFTLAKKILRARYFWMTMESDSICYFEASTYKAVTKKVVADFVRNNIVCRFWIRESIITDNAANFNNDLMKEIYEKFKILHRNSTAYRPQMNGAVEASNKNIRRILRKIVDNHSQWHEKISFHLLGYRTTIRTSTGATSYMLVYGTEAVIPLEVKIPSLRVIQEANLDDAEWIRDRQEQLMLIDEKKMDTVCHGQLY